MIARFILMAFKMLRTVVFIICFTSVHYCSGLPWERDNNIREFDLEWQCEQFCNRLKGKLTYNSSDSACTCRVNAEDKLGLNTKHLEHKLSDLGFNFKIIDETKTKIKKRDVPKTHGDTVETTGAKPEIEIPNEPKDEKALIKERIQRLREKLRNPKVEKSIITAPDNMILGQAVPVPSKDNVGDKPAEHKEEKVKDVKPPKVPDIKDTKIVGSPQDKQDPPKEEPKKIDRLDEIRAKLQALKQTQQSDVAHKNPEKVEEKKQQDNKKEDKKEDPSVAIRRPPLLPRPIHLPIIPRRPLRPILPLGAKPPNNEEADKNVPEKIKDIRERIRMRLQSIRAKTHPNEDGHVEENH